MYLSSLFVIIFTDITNNPIYTSDRMNTAKKPTKANYAAILLLEAQ